MTTLTAPSGINYDQFYTLFRERVSTARQMIGRPLTFAEKILSAHCADISTQEWRPGETMLRLRIDRVAMQDATAQMALLQFMQSSRTQVAVPTSIHCDHLVRAESGVRHDVLRSIDENADVYAFLRSAAAKYGIGFWHPGSGIIHQVVLENYAFPGGLMIGTDSHTPNAGGLGMIAVGVGGADAAEVMAGLPWEILYPKLIGVRLTGKLSGWTSAKDVIIHLCALLTTKGGTNKIIEYFGPGTNSISATGKATICNMGAELGATASVFPVDTKTLEYLRATGRSDLEDWVKRCRNLLRADPEVLDNPNAYYDQIVEVDLDTLEPYVAGPHSPDRGRPISKLGKEMNTNGWPIDVSTALVGSCTNSSYEDMQRAMDIARQALVAGLRPKTTLMISPGSDRVFQTIHRDGLVKTLEDLDATVLANACGPCIGQWKRTGSTAPNSIVTSFNRNFPARNDGNAVTHAFVMSPEMVVAFAFAGRLDFDPTHDALLRSDGSLFRFSPPNADALPTNGFEIGMEGYEQPSEHPEDITINIAPDNERLQLLQPFTPWHGMGHLTDLIVLAKTKGKTTTDHISPAGPWLRFRGHLDRISDNLLLGAVNAFTGETGQGTHPLSRTTSQRFSTIARELKSAGRHWVIIGDENYGEGSSREHAAMSPRHLGCAAVIARSFARIHETNLKKQGILPLTFVHSLDYDRIEEGNTLSIVDRGAPRPGEMLSVEVYRTGEATPHALFQVRHSLTEEQVAWFLAGSAMNATSQTSRP